MPHFTYNLGSMELFCCSLDLQERSIHAFKTTHTRKDITLEQRQRANIDKGLK